MSSVFNTPNLPVAIPPVVNQESINDVFFLTLAALIADGLVVEFTEFVAVSL